MFSLNEYPSIFWRDVNTLGSVNHNGSVVGAIPSALLASRSYLKKVGMSSVEAHMRSRIMNASLLIQDLFQSYPSFTKRISKVVFKELILVKAIASKCQHYYARSFKIYATVILIFFQFLWED